MKSKPTAAAPPLAPYMPDRKSQAAGEGYELTDVRWIGRSGGNAKEAAPPAAAKKKAPAKAKPAAPARVAAKLREAVKIAAEAAKGCAVGTFRCIRIRRDGELAELAASDGKAVGVRVWAEGLDVRTIGDVYTPAPKLWEIVSAADAGGSWMLARESTGRPGDRRLCLTGRIGDTTSLAYQLPEHDEVRLEETDPDAPGKLFAIVSGRVLRELLKRGGWLHEAGPRPKDDAEERPLPLLEQPGEPAPAVDPALVRLRACSYDTGTKRHQLVIEGATSASYLRSIADVDHVGPIRPPGLYRDILLTPRAVRCLAAWLSDDCQVQIYSTERTATFAQPHVEVCCEIPRGSFADVEDRPQGDATREFHFVERVDELKRHFDLACLGLPDLRPDLEIHADWHRLRLTAPVGGRTCVEMRWSETHAGPERPFARMVVDGWRIVEALSKLPGSALVQVSIQRPGAGALLPLAITTEDRRWRFEMLRWAVVQTLPQETKEAR